MWRRRQGGRIGRGSGRGSGESALPAGAAYLKDSSHDPWASTDTRRERPAHTLHPRRSDPGGRNSRPGAAQPVVLT
jgi:hypothetical protein